MAFRRSILVCALALSTLAAGGAARAQLGPPGGKIYASDRLFKTVATPTDLPDQGKFEPIYALGNGLVNVAEAAPGEPGFVGGRWEVHPVTWLTISPTQFTNSGQVHAAERAGQISIGPVIRRFECPLLPVE
jgi:hypothetical protein